jgi:[ribosomal protein S18]-alanine N-acetyltransferase
VTAGWRRPREGRAAREAREAREARAAREAREATTAVGDRPAGAGKAARLRPMTTADLADVVALERELFPEDPWTAQMFADEVVLPPEVRLYLVAEADAAAEPGIAGYAGMLFVPGGLQADVLTIAVRESHWGLGTGSALLGALIAAARERDCAEVFLEVRADNPRAHGLYLRRGFAEIGVRRGYYKPSGVDAIVMRKDLLR